MWAYVSGVGKPTPKTPTITQAEYERTKRKRKFDPKWATDFPWLFLDSSGQSGQVMACRSCRAYPSLADKDSSFVKGTSNFKLDTIRKHNDSTKHLRTSGAFKAAQAKPGETEGDKILSCLNKQQQTRLQHMFRTCHALAKNCRPFTDFVWHYDLDVSKGVDLGTTYRNDKAAQVFTHYIAEVYRLKLVDLVKDANFLSPMMDGSTDKSISEQEIVYVRTAKKGEVQEKFVSLEPVEKADAAGLLRALGRAMVSSAGEDSWKEKTVAIATDGASVNTGKKAGVVQRLREDVPHIVGIHCMAHRLELALNDATKSVNLQKVSNQLLLSLYLFYHGSSLNRANLKASFSSLGLNFLVPSRVGGTRWAAHTLRALNNMLRGYPALVQHLQQISSGDLDGASSDSKNKATGFLRILLSKKHLLYLHLLTDVLTHVSRVSELLQKRGVTLSEASDCLHATEDILVQYKIKPGPMLARLLGAGDVYHGFKLSDHSRDRLGLDFETSREQLLTSLLSALEKRFDASDMVVDATSLLNLESWPSKEKSAEFGEQEVDRLAAHFQDPLEKAGGDPSAIVAEWALLKAQLYRKSNWQQLTWSQINGLLSTTCPNALLLIDVLLAIPVATAECERGFSVMKRIKTEFRTCLKSSTLTDLQRINLDSPSVTQFDPLEAICLWQKSGHYVKRPDFMNDTEDDDLCSDGELPIEEHNLPEVSHASVLSAVPHQTPLAVCSQDVDEELVTMQNCEL